jgi:hypothetical protein
VKFRLPRIRAVRPLVPSVRSLGYAPKADGRPDPGEVVAQESGAGREWMDIGTGAWDSQGRPSEVRLNRLLRLDPAGVRREGAALPKHVFDAVIEAAKPYL